MLTGPFVDQHCHSLSAGWTVAAGAGSGGRASGRAQGGARPAEAPPGQEGAGDPAWRCCFVESTDGRALRRVPDLLGYRHFLGALGTWLDVDPGRPITELEPSVVRARDERVAAGAAGYLQTLFADAGIATLLVDTGLAGDRLGLDDLANASGRAVAEIVRVETEAERLLAESSAGDGPVDLADALAERLAGRLDSGAIGIKSIAAYRAGFPLPRPPAAAVRRALGEVRRARQAVRLDDPALVALGLWTAAELCADRGVPLQIHTGFGDADLELTRADPSLLRSLLLDPATEGCPIVLLHCYPFVRQAAYLAACYPNVWMDLSLAIPLAEPVAGALVAEALALCPVTKLVAASDGHSFPEMHWWGALTWRRALDEAVGDRTAGGARRGLSEADARLILGGNARRLYRLPG